MPFRGTPHPSRPSTLPALTLAILLAAFAPSMARSADTTAPTATPPASKTPPSTPPAGATPQTTAPAPTPANRKAAKEKHKADKQAARDAARQKKSDLRAKEDQEDIEAHRPWVRGANWLGFRAGASAASELGRPAPGPGFGIGYQHFRSRRWATGIQLDYDLVGKYGGAAEIDVPFHFELTRHFGWGDAMRPYTGLSAGGTWHRTYRTGADEAEMRPSVFLVGGANVPIGPRALMGADFRVGWEGSARSSDPVFPNTSNTLLTWRFKIAYLRWQ
jgi:hypothetical protein